MSSDAVEPEAPSAPTDDPAPPAPPAVASERPVRAPAGELLSALSALVLFVAMFATEWYGTVQLPHSAERSGAESSSTAWNQLPDVRWLMLLTVLVTLGSVFVHLSQRQHGSQTNTGPAVTAIAAITAVALFVRVLVDLPSPAVVVDAKLGAYIGLLAAVGVALGGFEGLYAHRQAARKPRHRPRRPPSSGMAGRTPAR